MDRDVNDAFKFNQETEMVPVLGLISSQLNNSTSGKTEVKSGESVASSIQANHHPALISLIADDLSLAPEQIHDFEL